MLYPSIVKFLMISWVLAVAVAGEANDDLPVLGDTTSGIISQQQEYELGRAWLRMFRSRVTTHDDPELQAYLEQLLFHLSVNSELTDHRLALVVVNNPTMNAFAVPGGVVGVHTGLFLYAESEGQLASVLSHELAHLSQRHFARSVDAQRKSSIVTMAGLLASLVIAATAGGDAGMAAMTATQAAAMESALRYSRQNEQEADRFGIETLYRAGFNPAAAPAMFERMLASTRYTGHRPPEFLLTHPLTEKRVADARGRVDNYPKRYYPDNLEYHLMRARTLIALDNSAARSIKRFASEIKGHSLSKTAARYGLALALSADGKHRQAREALMPLLQENPENLTLQLAAASLDHAGNESETALARVDKLLPLHADSYPLKRAKAEILLKMNRYQDAEQVLEKLARERPNDPNVWFQLAEVSGLAGDISGVHKARAEYFILVGVFDKAREQLGYAQKLVSGDFKQYAIIEQRLRDLAELEDKTKKL